MTKKEAAALLGVSEKTITRYVSSGRLPSRYVRGKTGQQLDFEESEILRFKSELETPIDRTNSITEPSQNETGGETGQDDSIVSTLVSSTSSTVGSPVNDAQIGALAQLVKAVIDAGQAETGQGRADRTSVSIGEKMLLTLADAQALTGLSRGTIVEAIKSGELNAQTIGRAYRLRPNDVKEWLDSKFEVGSKPKKAKK